MGNRWLIGLVGAVAMLAVTGIGFAAFTATATVNGQASDATVDLQIVGVLAEGCGTYSGGPAPGSGNISFSSISEAGNEVGLSVSNLTPAAYCYGEVVLENTGSTPLNLSVQVLTPGANGLCVTGAIDCYDVFTLSGIIVDGWICFYGAIDCFPGSSTIVPTYVETGFLTLNPGQTYTDEVGVDIPPFSDDSTPSTAVFSLVYTGSAGL